jgi:glutamyl-tRNA reductase
LQLAPEVFVLEPTLMVIGVNHRTAPLAMRERFWIGESRRYEALRQLKNEEGIEEVIVVSTCCRTEFLLWASEPTLAANSLVQYLGAHHSLKLSEWEHFYRLLDEAALSHIFRVSCGLDSQRLCELEVAASIKGAWEQAQAVGAAGPYLKAILERAFSVAEQVRNQTTIAKLAVSVPMAVLDVAKRVFGSIEGRKVLLLGTGRIGELCAAEMIEQGAGSVAVIDHSPQCAQELAQKLGGTAATLEERWRCLLDADIVIAATGSPHIVLTREEAERVAAERNRVALLVVDIGVPRDVDPDVRRVDGIILYDLDALERMVKGGTPERTAAIAEAEKMVNAEAQAFRSQLQARSVVPTIVALRHRLEEISRQELESFIEERGPFTREQDQSLHAITAHVIQKIASSLAHELKDLPEKEEQEQMTAVVTRLFHLDAPQQALAGTKLGREENERSRKNQLAIDY